jgi:hypothetical protein
MKLGQLRDEHTHQGHSIEDEMDLVVLGIEAGKEVPGRTRKRLKTGGGVGRHLPPTGS